jgi:hypothetical protein
MVENGRLRLCSCQLLSPTGSGVGGPTGSGAGSPGVGGGRPGLYSGGTQPGAGSLPVQKGDVHLRHIALGSTLSL